MSLSIFIRVTERTRSNIKYISLTRPHCKWYSSSETYRSLGGWPRHQVIYLFRLGLPQPPCCDGLRCFGNTGFCNTIRQQVDVNITRIALFFLCGFVCLKNTQAIATLTDCITRRMKLWIGESRLTNHDKPVGFIWWPLFFGHMLWC